MSFASAPVSIPSNLDLSAELITPANELVAAAIESFDPLLDCTSTVEVPSDIVIFVGKFNCAPACILSNLDLSAELITPANELVAAAIESFDPSLD